MSKRREWGCEIEIVNLGITVYNLEKWSSDQICWVEGIEKEVYGDDFIFPWLIFLY